MRSLQFFAVSLLGSAAVFAAGCGTGGAGMTPAAADTMTRAASKTVTTGDSASSNNKKPVHLAGNVEGTYTIQQANPDTGKTYQLIGSGRVEPLGAVKADGSFQTLGFIRSGTVTGQMTLTGAAGSVVLNLQATNQPGFGPPPKHFEFTIASGTGQFANAQGTGKAELSVNSNSSTAGTFKMHFSPGK